MTPDTGTSPANPNPPLSRYLARIIRAVIVSSLGFGGGIFLMIFILLLVTTGDRGALPVAFNNALIFGLAFGTILSLVLLLSDLTARLFVAQGNYEEIWELNQTRERAFEGTFKEAKRLCREALLRVPNVRSVSDADDERVINANVGSTWKSPGEHMHIEIISEGDKQFRLKCVSNTLAAHIAFDYAKNYENVETWCKTIDKLIEEANFQQLSGGG